MQRQIDWYFSLLSPWAYIGHQRFRELIERFDVQVTCKPVALLSVFDATGGLPLPKRHPARQRYRILELQRWRERRRLSFNLHPRFWPFDVQLADRFVIALSKHGTDPQPFLARAFAAVWEEDRNLADEATLASLAGEFALSAADLLSEARSAATAKIYADNVADAIAADAFGSPCFVLDGEVFWGQDRLELLEDALASGRQPYRPDA